MSRRNEWKVLISKEIAIFYKVINLKVEGFYIDIITEMIK